MAGKDQQPLLPSDNQGAPTVPWYKRKGVLWAAVGTIVGAPVAIVAAPLVVAGMGFGAGGIVAGSYAASMMSAAAIANGGAVAAGSTVAILQSIGAAGFGLAGLVGVGAAGAGVGAGVGAVAGAAADLIQNNGDAGDAGGNAGDAGNGGDAGDAGGNAGDAGNGGNAGSNGTKPMGQQPNTDEADSDMDKVELIIMDSHSNQHSFKVTLDELLLRVFTEFLGLHGLTHGTVRFELNGVQLSGGDTLRTIKWKIGDVVDAVLL